MWNWLISQDDEICVGVAERAGMHDRDLVVAC